MCCERVLLYYYIPKRRNEKFMKNIKISERIQTHLNTHFIYIDVLFFNFNKTAKQPKRKLIILYII